MRRKQCVSFINIFRGIEDIYKGIRIVLFCVMPNRLLLNLRGSLINIHVKAGFLFDRGLFGD